MLFARPKKTSVSVPSGRDRSGSLVSVVRAASAGAMSVEVVDARLQPAEERQVVAWELEDAVGGEVEVSN